MNDQIMRIGDTRTPVETLEDATRLITEAADRLLKNGKSHLQMFWALYVDGEEVEAGSVWDSEEQCEARLGNHLEFAE